MRCVDAKSSLLINVWSLSQRSRSKYLNSGYTCRAFINSIGFHITFPAAVHLILCIFEKLSGLKSKASLVMESCSKREEGF